MQSLYHIIFAHSLFQHHSFDFIEEFCLQSLILIDNRFTRCSDVIIETKNSACLQIRRTAFGEDFANLRNFQIFLPCLIKKKMQFLKQLQML